MAKTLEGLSTKRLSIWAVVSVRRLLANDRARRPSLMVCPFSRVVYNLYMTFKPIPKGKHSLSM
jgi:hypothetical protein